MIIYRRVGPCVFPCLLFRRGDKAVSFGLICGYKRFWRFWRFWRSDDGTVRQFGPLLMETWKR